MTTAVNDTLTDTDGTSLTAHPGETGATWTRGSGQSGAVEILSNRAHSTAAGGGTFFSSGTAGTDGEYVEAVLHFFDTAGDHGIGLRGNVAGVKAYIAMRLPSAWAIYRQDDFTTLTSLQSFSESLSAGTDYTVRLTATGTGASVALVLTVNGVSKVTYSDTSGSRLTSPGSAVIYADGVTTGSTGTHIASITMVDAATTVTFSTPNNRIFRHSAATWSLSATGSIVDSGSYGGTAPNQARLVQYGTSTALPGFDWATIGSASAGSWSHTFTSVPQGVGSGWYSVQVRDSGTPGTIYTSGKRGVGIHIGHYGQSQSSNQPLIGSGTLTPTGLAIVHGDSYASAISWAALDTSVMDALIAADIYLQSVLGGNIPVLFLNVGYPGTSLVRGGPNGNWLPTSGTLYQYGKTLIDGINGAGRGVDAFVDIRGESDASEGTVTQAEFYAGLGTLYTQTRSDFGANLPIVQVILGSVVSYFNDASAKAIRDAQVQRYGDANTYRVESYDCALGGDGLHRNATGMAEVGRRWAKAVAKALGVVSGYRSPRITAVVPVSGTVYDATVAYEGGGSDFTITGSLSELSAVDSVSGTALTISSATRQSATKIRITLSTTPTNPPSVRVAYGFSVTAGFADDTSLALPLEYNAGVLGAASFNAAWARGSNVILGVL